MIDFMENLWRKHRTALVILALIAAFALGLALRGGGSHAPATETAARGGAEQGKIEYWTCSMHPNIHQPGPGKCPICGMDLIPVYSEGAEESIGPREIKLSEAARALAEIRTAPVVRKRVAVTLRLAGKIETDETRESKIAAWVPGRLDRVFVAFTGGKIDKGEPLVELYSPELLTAQQELLASGKARQAASGSAPPGVLETATRTAAAAREKLRLWGLTAEQIDEIERRGSPSDRITITAPAGGTVTHKNAVEGMYVQTGTLIYTISDLSHLWVMLDAYESDLVWIRNGQKVVFTADAAPGERFAGTVVFVDPEVDPTTRAVKVRVELPNPGERLKPGMFVHAMVEADAAGGSSKRAPLVVPATAPLVTGTRAVVYVALPGEEGRYEGREVVLGPRAGEYYVVRSGLAEGEMVVVNGAFKIDSEMQILAKPSMMSPEGAAPPVHHHDAGSAQAAPAPASAPAHAPAPVAEERMADTAGTQMELQRRLAGVFGAYFDTHKALSRDNLADAKKAAGAIGKALDAVGMWLFSGDAHETWMSDAKRVRESAAGIAAAKNIAAARVKFEPLSDAMYDIAKSFGAGTVDSLFLIHCPMAFDGKGADWLQTRPATENPYFGSSMFTCGVLKDTVLGGAHTHHE
jgi:Cu(I)/Ag(I) efflux system membrane fusion protein